MPGVRELLALDKLSTLRQLIKHNGGLRGCAYKMVRMNFVKLGTLVGTDKYNNKYYMNNSYFFGKSRWVEYNDKVSFDFDASQVPPEWHNWLHYMVDDHPNMKPRVHYKWMVDHVENASGTRYQYTPYSTTTDKIKSWQPPNSTVRIGPSK